MTIDMSTTRTDLALESVQAARSGAEAGTISGVRSRERTREGYAVTDIRCMLEGSDFISFIYRLLCLYKAGEAGILHGIRRICVVGEPAPQEDNQYQRLRKCETCISKRQHRIYLPWPLYGR